MFRASFMKEVLSLHELRKFCASLIEYYACVTPGTEKPKLAKRISLERLEESRYINRSVAHLNDMSSKKTLYFFPD